MTQNQYNNTETLEYRKNSILQLNANGKSIEECIKEGSKIDMFDNGDYFEINNLNVTFKSISIGNVNENRVEFLINTNLEVSIHSSQQQVITIPKTVS
ncbi:Uncharacterised protein [Chlamydia trachomatis]|nr:Uncharacterised protein [Chlamydia trachomatis]CRH48749.1 Uncharacterised protein [Chlamydia trachomatis]CRH55665.1 Uncharacterised protein [Chlamydia trachomatis]